MMQILSKFKKSSVSDSNLKVEPGTGKFSTFAGVFTPSILSILGVVMFMRANMVVGYAGVYGALLILLISKSITATTGLSISAIATNTDVKGGGAYYLISRTLGPEFGATIGLTLFIAQSLSIPFYVLGFSESLVRTFPIIQPYFQIISFVIVSGLFLVTWKGAEWAIKTQYVIMALLIISILAFTTGAILKFDNSILTANKMPQFTQNFTFTILLAIYFPAVTGILAGVNMSGDLKNPGRSIPLGTMAAIAVGAIIYGGQMILCGGSINRDELIANPYHSLINLAPFHTGFLVVMGVFCATLSSALGALLAAPRVLQSLGQDRLLKPVNFFAKLSTTGEPRRALILSFIISLIVIYTAGNSSDGGSLNKVAPLVSMFFLWTYGIINLAAFVETFSRNPSFRPRFRFFHWLPALGGAIASFGISFLIDAFAAFSAAVLVILLFLYVRKHVLKASFGDARRGFIYTRVRDHLFTLANLPLHSKNWRPTIVVLSGNPTRRLTLIKSAEWLSSGRGITILTNIITGDFHSQAESRKDHLDTLNQFMQLHRIKAFAEVVIADNFDSGLSHFLQSVSIGPIKPNLALFGWSSAPERSNSFFRSIQTARLLNMSTVLVWDGGLPDRNIRKKKRIDIWWRGKQNGSLMVILAYLISLNNEWSGSQIRILRIVKSDDLHDIAYNELKNLIDFARIRATVEIICSPKDFHSILHEKSSDAQLIFLGFDIPTHIAIENFQNGTTKLLQGLPTTLLVSSTGEADLLS